MISTLLILRYSKLHIWAKLPPTIIMKMEIVIYRNFVFFFSNTNTFEALSGSQWVRFPELKKLGKDLRSEVEKGK